MTRVHVEICPGIMAPWGDQGHAFAHAVQQRIGCDAVMVSILDLPHPRLDAILGVQGIDADTLVHWCASGHKQDTLMRAAHRHGAAVTSPGVTDQQSPLHDGHLMLLMMPESLLNNRWWLFFAARNASAFTSAEQQQAEFMLRQWRIGFCQMDEPGAGRLMIGHDDRILHADPYTEQRLLTPPTRLEELLGLFRPIVAQRWANITDQLMRDVAMDLSGTGYWIRFCRTRAVDRNEAEHWFLELRPLEKDDLPTVHQVEDERVARAIAFIHDNFKKSPSLTDIAQAVHVSPFHFHRVFTKQVGLSPKHYLQRKQMQVAKWLLRATRTPVGRLAKEAGFSSHGHFTSTFRRLIGASPSEYRDRN